MANPMAILIETGPKGKRVVTWARYWAPKTDVELSLDDLLTPEGLATHRAASCDAIRALHPEGGTAGKWPLRYLIRHTAYHPLDHAWEMEDKDLTGA